jgi:mannosyltransferase
MVRHLSPQVSIIILTALGLVVRLYHVDYQSLWRDEVDVLLFSSQDLPTLLVNFLKQGENGPLYYVIHHYWQGAFGDSEVALRLPSALFGAAVVPMMFALGRQLLDVSSARLGALLAAFSPYYVWYSQDAKMYSLLVLVTVASFLLYLRALKADRVADWVAYVVVTTLGLYVHLFFALIVLTQIVLFLLLVRKWRMHRWFISTGLLTLPYLPLALWQVPTLLSPPPTAYPSLSPPEVLTVLSVMFVRGLGPVDPFLPLVLAVFMVTSSVVFYGRLGHDKPGGERAGTFERRSIFRLHRGLGVLCIWLVVPLAGFLLLSMRLPLFADRYLIIVTPAFYLLVAAGFAALHRYWRPAFWAAAAFWLAIGAHSLDWQAHVKLKSDFRSAAASFRELAKPDDLVIFNMPYVRHTFQYYYREPLRWIGAPYTNDGRSAQRVDRYLEAEVGDSEGVWLVSSEEHLWDDREMVREWLETNLTRLESQTFSGVHLVRYTPRMEKTDSPGDRLEDGELD